MTTLKIAPRVDEHGVPWCSYNGCSAYMNTCSQENDDGRSMCAPAVRDLAAEVAAWRSGGVPVYKVGEPKHPIDYAKERTDAWRKR